MQQIDPYSLDEGLRDGDDTNRLDAIQTFLRSLYSAASREPIQLPDERGAFPPADGLFGEFSVPPLVVDANVLRNDILYACRYQRRTSLVTATNAGFLRTYCGSHVHAEVEEHAVGWALDNGVDPDEYRTRWRGEYVPLLRRVEVPDGLLTEGEATRITDLERNDHDDVPSATLALLLGAFYLSEDRRALEAVYGPGLDKELHHGWLQAVRSGSNNRQLTITFQSAFLFPALLGQGVVAVGKRLCGISPWLLAGVLGGALGGGYFLWRSESERVQRVRSGVGGFLRQLFEALDQLRTYMEECQVTFSVMFPRVPTWQEMRDSHLGEQVLARHCLYELARETRGHCSASEMHEGLPFRITGQEATVRKVLRQYDCFEAVGRGRWQLGRPVIPFDSIDVADGGDLNGS